MQEKRDYLWIQILSFPPTNFRIVMPREKRFRLWILFFFVRKESSDKKKRRCGDTILNVLDACLMHVWNFGLLKQTFHE